MKTTEAVRSIMENTGVGLAELANRTGKSMQVTWARLSQDNISVVKLNEMLSVLGYKVVLMPQDTEMAEGWYKAE